MTISHFLNKKNIFNILLAIFPISFILGNPAINFNIVLFILFSLSFYRTRIFFFNYILADKLLIIFFLVSVLSLLFNNFSNLFIKDQTIDLDNFFKTIFFFRYLLFYLSLRYLFENNRINLNLFFIVSSFSVLFVSIDIFYQFYFDEDIFGFKSSHYKISGPFGEELVAGSYLQRFSFFLLLTAIFLTNKKKKIIKDTIIIFLFLIILLSIIISGNRIPAILFTLSIIISIIYLVPSRKYLLIVLLTIPLLTASSLQLNQKIKNNFFGFYDQIKNITYNYYFNEKDFTYKKVPEHIWHFKSGIDTWSMNKMIGGGIKSFRLNCWEALKINKSTWSCATHPHNYYIEILADLGLVGFLIILSTICYFFYYFYFNRNNNQNMRVDYAFKVFFLLILMEFFPIKSTGSFFSTFNAAYIFLILPIFFSIVYSKTKNE